MKGLIFTGLLSMIETKYGYELVDQLLTECDLPSGGNYMPFGSYDLVELTTLVNKLSQEINLPVPDLFRIYGQYMFLEFIQTRQYIVNQFDSGFSLIKASRQFLQLEARKLYTDAEEPNFISIDQPSDEKMIIHYHSEYKLNDFFYGLLDSCFVHFGEKVTIVKTNLAEDGSQALFEIVRDCLKTL